MSEKSVEKTKKTRSQKKEKPKALVYCGPTLPGGQLQRFSIFKNGKPEHLQAIMKDCPEIEKLFVPYTKLAITRTKLAEKGTREHQLYQQILNHTKGV